MSKIDKKIKTLICLDCNEEFISGKLLSHHVQTQHGYENYTKYKIHHGLVKSDETLLNEGALKCKLCGKISHDLVNHIINGHKMDINNYKQNYGPIRSEKYIKEQSDRISGNKNPAYQHGGKFSPLSDKFIYSNKINKEKVVKKISNSNKMNGNNDTTIVYWLNRGYSEDEAKLKIKERQTTFSLEICIEKYGKIEGTKRWEERQSKWLKSAKASQLKGFSRISQELFWKIFKELDDSKKASIYFAQLDETKNKDLSGKNNEYTLRLFSTVLSPDFIDIETKKIIEFDGTYWHGKRLINYPNRLRDEDRDAILMANGYTVLHIPEQDFRKEPNKMIKICLEFLNG